MSDTKLPFVLKQWQDNLNITQYSINCERISPFQVSNENSDRGHEFVGICTDHDACKASLFHTRKLITADIVHELLHVKYPEWSEEQVNNETKRLMMQKYVRKEVVNH